MPEGLTIEVTTKHVITPQAIDDILCAAFEGGINYWCSRAEAVGRIPEGAEFASDVVSRGGEVMLVVPDWHGVGHDEGFVLNREKFLKGLGRAVSEGRIPGFGDKDGEWVGDVDAGIADTIVQYALFDEQVFA